MLVIDASVTLSWCFADESTDHADRILERLADEGAVAPSIWPFEVANGLRSAERRGRLSAADLVRLRHLLASLPVQVVSVDLATATGELLELARAHDLSAYDAAYLELAGRLGLELATTDVRLADACVRAGIPVAR